MSDDEASPSLRARVGQQALKLLAWLAVIALLVIPLLKDLPLGDTTRAGIIAWVLVGIAIYWLFTDLGYRPLLLMQLLLFSAAVACLSAKVFLLTIGIHRLSILRRTAIWLIGFGALCAGLNLAIMLLHQLWSRPSESDLR